MEQKRDGTLLYGNDGSYREPTLLLVVLKMLLTLPRIISLTI